MRALIFFPLFFLSVKALPATSYCDLPELAKLEIQKNATTPLRIDRIVVNKALRHMYLVSQGTVWKSYIVALGHFPVGPKEFEGDGKTPEGSYRIDYHHKESGFHNALKISYPNADDRKRAETAGKKPGGDIMIHGFPNDYWKSVGVALVHPSDWTTGCIAVTNTEIDEIAALIKDDTHIDICAGPQLVRPPVVPPKPGAPPAPKTGEPKPEQPAPAPATAPATGAGQPAATEPDPQPNPWYWL